MKPSSYQWDQMNETRNYDDLREVWTIVTAQPGISLRAIAAEMGTNLHRSKYLVDTLLESGTLTRDGDGRIGTLRATVPMIVMEQK